MPENNKLLIENCIWCGNSRFEICFEGPDRLERKPGRFRLVRCSQCGLISQNPRLSWEDLLSYYPPEYASYSYSDLREEGFWKRIVSNYGNVKRRKAIERFQKSGRLLEVGCGTGGFLRELIRSGGWDVVGIEPSQKAAEHSRLTTNATIYQARFSDIQFEPESFDVIVLWTVLEHLEQPIHDLVYAHALLKNHGWLFLSIPNVESLEAKIFKQYWAGWDLPRHLYIFPRHTLRQILGSIGFDILDERCLSTSYHALGHSIDFWSQIWEDKYPRLKKNLMRLYYSSLVRIGLILPLAILDRLNLSSTITISAQKR